MHPFPHFLPYGLLQSIERRSLCYSAGPCCNRRLFSLSPVFTFLILFPYLAAPGLGCVLVAGTLVSACSALLWGPVPSSGVEPDVLGVLSLSHWTKGSPDFCLFVLSKLDWNHS